MACIYVAVVVLFLASAVHSGENQLIWIEHLDMWLIQNDCDKPKLNGECLFFFK